MVSIDDVSDRICLHQTKLNEMLHIKIQIEQLDSTSYTLVANLVAQASILALVHELIVDFTTWPCGAVD